VFNLLFIIAIPSSCRTTFTQNVHSHIKFLVFVFLVSNVVALLQVAIEGVYWARDGPKFVCKIDGCGASYTTKYNLVQHLQTCHNVTMELGKLGHPSTRKQGLRVQNHATMNAHVLNNPLIWFYHNE
jgi:hypothetical protein